MARPDPPDDLGLLQTAVADHATRGSHADTVENAGAAELGDLPAPGYQLGALLGRGGMGEVLLARDARIGRSVAIKRMRAAAPTPDATARFLREARIQARLDHPAIVPVHELGLDPDGRPYFTMKRLTGTTLQDKLTTAGAGLQALLRAFVDVCLAIDFAHARGVVHRDLKPSNIMLGDYGEVYVLDWGVARVLDPSGAEPTSSEIPTLDGNLEGVTGGGTQVGALLGTPGYMAPEQARGESVGAAADIYALGCILFEILAHDPVHPTGAGALASTLTNSPGTPSQRSPDRGIAPELDALCVEALASDPAARPTARALADRTQRYLDGDRDVALRHALAAAEVDVARAALARDDAGGRVIAIRAAGHAMALDPKSADAAALVSSLVFEPPRVFPPALVERLVEADATDMDRQWRTATYAYAVFYLFLPFLIWQGIHDWRMVGTGYACITGIMILGGTSLRRWSGSAAVALVLNTIMMILFTRLYGPILVVPGVLAIQTFAWMSYPQFIERPIGALVLMSGTLALPMALEALGVFAPSWVVRDHSIIATSSVIEIAGLPTSAMLVTISIATVFVAGVFAHALAKGRREAQRALEIRSWALRQLLPA